MIEVFASKPIVLIVGAQRSGTTFLAKTIERVFDAKILRPGNRPGEPRLLFLDSGPKWLDEENIAERQIIVDKSTSYLRKTDVISRILELSSEVKIISVLREPLSRAISAYKFSQENGIETRAFSEIVDMFSKSMLKEPDSGFGYSENPFSYFEGSSYSQFLESWLEAFGSENLQFFTSEFMWERTGDFSNQLSNFLKLSSSSSESVPLKKVNSNLDYQLKEYSSTALNSEFIANWLEQQIVWCEEQVFKRPLNEWRNVHR